jgi:hypothetical protein
MARPPRLGQDLAGRQRPELSVVALVLILQPHLGELGDDVLPDLLGAVHVFDIGEEAEDLVASRSATGAELEPVAREMVEHGHPLGHLGRMIDLGQGVEDARADVRTLGGVGQVAQDHVVGREVGVLLQEVVLTGPDILEPRLVGCLRQGDVFHERRVLGVGISRRLPFRNVSLDENSKLHWHVLNPQDSRTETAANCP